MNRTEWIDRAVAAGAPSADYADSLYMAYTDDGVSAMTPEEIVAEDAAVISAGRGLVPNARVEGRDAASSRRVPSHGGFDHRG